MFPVEKPTASGAGGDLQPVPPHVARDRAASAVLTPYLARARVQLTTRARLGLWAAGLRIFVGVALLLGLVSAAVPALDLRTLAPLCGGAIVLGLWIALGEARRRSDEVAVAEALRPRHGAAADELRSLVELEAANKAGRLQRGHAFLVLLRERVAEALANVPLDEALPLSEARRTLARSVLFCALAVAATTALRPRLLPDAWAALRHGPPRDASPASAPPIVGDLELELTPPAYTGLPPRTIPASSGDLRALPGTVVQIRARSLIGAVARAVLLFEPATGATQTLPAEIEPGKGPPRLRAHFTVGSAGRYRFALWRWTGRAAEPEGHRVEIDPDLPPRVELRAPADPLELEVPRPVELGVDLEDDFGLGEVALVYRVGEGEAQRIPITIERPTPRRARGVYLWETGALEQRGPLPPDAKITYWIEGKDNDAVSGAKVGRSRVLQLVLRPRRDPAAIDRAALEALLEATLAALADRLDGSGSDETRHAALVALAARYAAIANTGAAKPADGKSATAALQRLAGTTAGRLSRLAAKEAGPGGLRGAHQEVVTELENDALALDDLRAKRRLEQMARIGDEMKRARDQLRRLFDELKTATSDAQRAELKREIERKLMELESRMAELRRLTADAEGEVPDEFLNREAIGKQDVKKNVDGIREMLERGDFDKAMAELDRMSRSLDQLTGAIDRGQREQRQAADPAAEQALSQLENDLADLSREEREIEHEARAIRERGAASQPDAKALLDRLRPKLAELERRADEQAHDGRMVDREDLDRMRARARGVARALESNDVDEAQGMALDARRLAEGMSSQLNGIVAEEEARAQARVGDGPSPQLRRGARRLAEAETLAQQIEAELERAGNSRPNLDANDRRRLDELSRRQSQAQRRGEELMQRMGQSDQPGMSGLPEGARRDVDGARQSIGESGRHLQRPAPRRGADAAAQAAERLDAARKQVSQARRGGQGGEADGQNAQQRDEPVRIPGADDSAAPRAFREELLDAMKRGAPRRFEEQVQKYYEELVK